MKRTLAILLLIISFASYSQKQDSIVTIKGVVVDAETQESLPFANVVLYNDKKQIDFVQTDFDGKFKLKAKKEHQLMITSVGFRDTVIEVKEIKNKPVIKLEYFNGINSGGTINYKLMDIEYSANGKILTAEEIDIAPTRKFAACSVSSDTTYIDTIIIKEDKNFTKKLSPHYMEQGEIYDEEDIKHTAW